MRVSNIKTIDLESIDSISDLHLKFSNLLNFPNSYNNSWDAFEDLIINKKVEMPQVLIMYGSAYFSKHYPNDSTQLESIIRKYNTIYYNYNEDRFDSIIELDFPDGLETNKIESIFKKRPFQFGLRGDLPLWDELENYFKDKVIPNDEYELIDKIHSAMISLTGKSTLESGDYFVKKYNIGGMSGGSISSTFWEKKGIPLLVGRYRKIKKSV